LRDLKLSEAALLPKQVAAIHCPSHQQSEDQVARVTGGLTWKQRRSPEDLISRLPSCGNNPSFLLNAPSTRLLSIHRLQSENITWIIEDGGQLLRTNYFFPQSSQWKLLKTYIKPIT
jgi:hypothetical protein